MPYRCEFHLNGGRRKLVVARGSQETHDHLALRLAAAALFWAHEPKFELSAKHPALADTDFRPDFAGLDAAGAMALWGECGNVSLNKLDKLTRRFPGGRIVVLKASEAEGKKSRADLADALDRHSAVEVLAFRAADFALWRDAVGELVEVFGESDERSLNLVINDVPLACDLDSY